MSPDGPSAPPKPKPKTGMWLLIGCIGAFVLCCPILAAIIYPVFAQARKAAIRTQCLSNLKNIGMAAQLYLEQNNDTFWEGSDYRSSIRPYWKGPRAIRDCQETKVPYAQNEMLSGLVASIVTSPANFVTFYEGAAQTPSYPHDGSGNFLFLNGSARRMRLDTFNGTFDPKGK